VREPVGRANRAALARLGGNRARPAGRLRLVRKVNFHRAGSVVKSGRATAHVMANALFCRPLISRSTYNKLATAPARFGRSRALSGWARLSLRPLGMAFNEGRA